MTINLIRRSCAHWNDIMNVNFALYFILKAYGLIKQKSHSPSLSLSLFSFLSSLSSEYVLYCIEVTLYYTKTTKTSSKNNMCNLIIVLTTSYLKFEIHFIHKIEKNCVGHKWSTFRAYFISCLCFMLQ